MNFSFFYKAGSAGYVRGEQIADYLDGKKNPEKDFEDDICVYVKTFPSGTIPRRTYIDVDDAPNTIEWIKEHPEVGIIVTAQTAKDFLSKELNRTDINVIPHAHCNYERWIRPKREIKIIGIIGSITSFQYPVEEFRKKLINNGLKLIYEQDYWNTYKSTPDMPGRLKVVAFHKTIDIQVVWRPKMVTSHLKNPNKLVNAGSFGIPTVAYPEFNFENEWKGYYISVNTIDKMIEMLCKLRDDYSVYKDISIKALQKADENHIEKIAKLYEKL